MLVATWFGQALVFLHRRALAVFLMTLLAGAGAVIWLAVAVIKRLGLG